MAELQFELSREDLDRLYAVKEEWGRAELTGNEFAALLLSTYLYRLHPEQVKDKE